MTATVYNGKKGIPAAFVNLLTTENDVKMVAELMNEIIKNLNFKNGKQTKISYWRIPKNKFNF